MAKTLRYLTALLLVGISVIGCSGADANESATALESDLTDPSDGPPVRNPCTSSFGSGLATGSFGRLDGTIVAVVPPGAHGCHADAHHIHLQVAMQGSVYDVAINVAGVNFTQADAALADGPWSEGWHGNATLDYTAAFGLHSTNFTPVSETALTTEVESLLAQANHVSVFATKYGRGGIHLVHRNGNGNDGAIVIHPLAGSAHYLAFDFPRQTF